jgi:dihydrofolate synthase/folylpolyglutamate synthase
MVGGLSSADTILDRLAPLGMRLSLEPFRRLLAKLGEPQRDLPAVLVAGTNGKGSTAAMLQEILTRAGYRAALYTSPHLVSFTERIRIGDREISPDEVVAVADEISRRTDLAGVPLTFFEFVTVMAFLHFARQGIDIAVIEVGLGGRLDATNVVTPLVSVITTISKDHQAYLGPDELAIAREKGGIIKRRVPLILGKLSANVTDLLRGMAQERRAPAYSLGADFNFFLKEDGRFDYTGMQQNYSKLDLALAGRHQRANAAVALASLEAARARFPVDENAVRAGLQHVRWPGRLETVLQRPRVVLDGAHNPEGVEALIDELRRLPRAGKLKLLFATMADKEWQIMLRALGEIVDEIVLTRVDMERSADPQVLAAAAGETLSHRVIADAHQAARTLLQEAAPEDVIVIAGSLYLLGEVRPLLDQLAEAKAVQTRAPKSLL